MKVILTTFHGPTNHRSSRIIASDGDNRVSYSFEEDDTGQADNHLEAALRLAHKLKWSGYLASGTISKHGKFVANVYVWTDKDALIRVEREGK
jgi:hypothetical protein